MKSFQVIILSAFGFMALVGVYLFATFSGGVTGGQAIGTLSIWGTLPATAIDAGLSSLRTANKKYNDVAYSEIPADTFDRVLADAIAEGAGPDLIIISQEELLSQKNKLSVIPSSTISQRAFVDTYVPMAELFLTDGGTYGIPLVIDPLVMYYNRSILASAGIAGSPSTWEAVNALTPSITGADDSRTVTRSTIPFGEYSNVTNARAILSLLLLQAGTPISENTEQGYDSLLTNRSETNTGGTEVSESAVSFYTQFANPAKTVYTWNRSLPNSTQAFVGGDLALYPGYASEQPYLSTANPNLDFDMAPVPQPATLANRMTYAKLYAFAIPRASFNPAGASDVAFALGEATHQVIIAQTLAMAPATRFLLTPSEEDRFGSVYYPETLVAKGWLSPAPETVDSIFASMIGNITSGRRDTREALTAADQSLKAALNQ